jgi:hypothetical protein
MCIDISERKEAETRADAQIYNLARLAWEITSTEQKHREQIAKVMHDTLQQQ